MRRGLSTVIGAVFMIIVIIGALNVTLWMLQQQDRVAQAMTEKTSGNLDRLNEKIEISNIKIDGSKLNMTITNSGGQLAKLKSLYVVDETAVPKQQYRYDLEIPVDGRDSAKNVGQDVAFTATTTSLYSVKVVTEAGSTASSVVAPLSAVMLPMSLYAIPPTVTPTGSNVTLLFAVTNNVTDSTLGTEVTPILDYDTTCAAGPGCELIEKQVPVSTHLGKGNTILFKWVYEVDMPDLAKIHFNATLAGAKQGNFVTETVLVKKIDESNVSESTTLIIHSDLLQKPEIFLIVPGPFGDSAQRGLWGVVISNPTEVPITVSRIVISTYSTLAAQGSLDSDIVPKSTTCEIAIYPDPGSSSQWTCPHVNMIEWKNTASPETVDPLGSKSFLARILPGNVEDEPAFMVSAAVFTNMGQFTKTGYSSGMSKANNAVANVFASDTNDPLLAYQDSHIRGHVNGIGSGSTIEYNVTVVDFDTAGDKYIKSGTKLVINVPRGFSEVAVTSSTGFNSPTTTQYSDGSTQIVATLSQNVGDISGTEAVVLSFTARAPVAGSDKIYLMYVLLDGLSTPNDFPVGAFAQVPLQVVP